MVLGRVILISAKRVPELDPLPSIFASFENNRVAGNPKFWVLPDISGIPRHDWVFQVKHHHSLGLWLAATLKETLNKRKKKPQYLAHYLQKKEMIS